MARELVASDDFTGAAGALDAAWSGWRGTPLERDGAGNAVLNVNSATNGSFRNTGAYNSNQYCEVEASGASNGGGGHNIDVGVRGTTGENGYLAIVRTTGVDLYKVVASVFNLIANVGGAQTWVAGDLFSIEVQDNEFSQPVFKVFKNAVQIGTDITDTGASPFTSGRPIVCLRQDGAPQVLLTSWNGGNVITTSPFAGTAATAAMPVFAAAGSGLFGVLHYVTGVLIDEVTKNPLANLSGMHASWFDQGDPALMGAPVEVTTTLTTNGSGAFQFNLPNTLLTTGQTGLMVLSDGPLVDTAAYRLTVQ